ncbi:MAG: hypothetical protein ACE148_08990 [Vicinamibacterales bacterium]
MSRFTLIVLFVYVFIAAPVRAQGPTPAGSLPGRPAKISPALTTFLDCRRGCWSDYVKTELAFVDYVNVREMADVHVVVTAVVFATLPNESDQNRHRQFVEILKLGPVRYAVHTELGSDLRVSHTARAAVGAPSASEAVRIETCGPSPTGSAPATGCRQAGTRPACLPANRFCPEGKPAVAMD